VTDRSGLQNCINSDIAFHLFHAFISGSGKLENTNYIIFGTGIKLVSATERSSSYTILKNHMHS
jgi:hypothetical protein